jgi:hypothetical protein
MLKLFLTIFMQFLQKKHLQINSKKYLAMKHKNFLIFIFMFICIENIFSQNHYIIEIDRIAETVKYKQKKFKAGRSFEIAIHKPLIENNDIITVRMINFNELIYGLELDRMATDKQNSAVSKFMETSSAVLQFSSLSGSVNLLNSLAGTGDNTPTRGDETDAAKESRRLLTELKLLAEKNNIKSDKFDFIEYWDKIPSLTLKESCRALNVRRVNLKHKGISPSKADIETARVNSTDFFEQNTITHFQIEFKEVSLLALLTYENVKKYLQLSQEALLNKKYAACTENAAYAFDELLHSYETNKRGQGYSSPFLFGKDMSFMNAFFMHIKDRELGRFIDTVGESINSIKDALRVLSLGIDYRKFLKFDYLTPAVFRIIGGKKEAHIMGKRKWTDDNCGRNSL